MDLDYSELGGNDLDIRVYGWSDPNEVISHNLSESDSEGARFLTVLHTFVPPTPLPNAGYHLLPTGSVIDCLSTASGGGQSLTPCEVNSWCGMEGLKSLGPIHWKA
jgi:hypothetical protein